jgi:hypothetical protein
MSLNEMACIAAVTLDLMESTLRLCRAALKWLVMVGCFNTRRTGLLRCLNAIMQTLARTAASLPFEREGT